ncbi:MAG TPA: transmembrane 220 family protein [Flavitalea sp.]|nr:transmembrane 220 family protein [Flavitalea sp.]
MKIINIAFSVVFVVFAALQYNDLDPYIWIPIYLYAAVLCWLAARNKYYPKLMMAGVAVYAVYGIYLFFAKDGVEDWITQHDAMNIAQQMKASTPWIEETREFFGLCIVSFALLMNYIYVRRKNLLH